MKRNCWTCKHNEETSLGSECRGPVGPNIRGWWVQFGLDITEMPPHDADGCPGWAERGVAESATTADNGFATAPERYTRQERERVRSRTLVEEGL